MHILNNGIKRIANSLGIEITRLKNVPSYTFMGLRDLSIKTIIDVGANKGQFAEKALTVFPNAKFYSFEPLPTAFEELTAWANSVDNTQIKAFNVALGDEEGEVEMFFHTEHSTSSSILASTNEIGELYPFTKKQKSVAIELTTMDKFFEKNKLDLESDILIKLDVQGFEDRVIKGGGIVFSKALACIVEVSIIELYEQQADFKTLIDLLYSLGFHYAGNFEQSYSENGECIFFDAVFINSQNKKIVEH